MNSTNLTIMTTPRSRCSAWKRKAFATLGACIATLAALAAAPASAAPAPLSAPQEPPQLTATPLTSRLQTAEEALAQDAAEYARLYGVSAEEALLRLRAQEDSVAETDRLRELYRDRLAGISIEHDPDYRIAVLLTGDEPVAERIIQAGGKSVPITFRTGAQATQAELVAALREHQATIRDGIPRVRGMGINARTGKLTVLMRSEATRNADLGAAEAILSGLTGVPSEIHLVDGEDRNLAIEGGARVVGIDPADGRRYACTTGFVVTDASRMGILTAAHCPDQLSYVGPDGRPVPLAYVNAWGAVYQDVQVHAADQELKPQFLVDRIKGIARPLLAQRPRASTRVGDLVCRRGESSGYSCAPVEYVDFAPPGDLCAGPCDPVWVSVAGPVCRSGDSGGPIFLGTTAFGITKGASYDPKGGCSFYFYMSTDYLPEGWSLLLQPAAPAAPPDGQVGPPAVTASATR